MLLDHDNVVPVTEPSVDAVVAPAETPCVTVIYRTRGIPWLLIPPLLILVSVSSVTLYRKIEPDRPQIVYLAAAPTEPDPARLLEFVGPPSDLKVPIESNDQIIGGIPSMVEVPSIVSLSPHESGPIQVEKHKDFAPPPTYVATAESDPPLAPEKPPVRDPVGFDPAALRVATSERPATESPTPAEIVEQPPAGVGDGGAEPAPGRPLDDLQRESRRIATERRRLASVKRPNDRPAPAADRQQRAERIALAKRESDAKRQAFLDDLKRIVRENGDASAQAIDDLCEQTGRDTATELLDAAFGELSGPASRFTTRGKVQRLRQWGVPEPIILDHLIDTEAGNIGGRHGVKGQAALVVRAAQILLSIPLGRNPAQDTTAAAGRYR